MYGSGGISNGMLTEVTDWIYNIRQTFTYQAAAGGGIGQLSSVYEAKVPGMTGGYTMSYTYNDAGERATAIYATPNGTTKWGYFDYVRVGAPDGPKRVFQTLTKLDGAGNPTAEEFHYQFDSVGRLTHAAFAQTAQNGSAPYYTAEEPADSRAHAVYQYGPGGQMWGLAQYWEVLGTGEYPYALGLVCADTGGVVWGRGVPSFNHVSE